MNCLHGNELDRKDNEEETVQMEAAQSVVMMKFSIGVNLMYIVKAELATA